MKKKKNDKKGKKDMQAEELKKELEKTQKELEEAKKTADRYLDQLKRSKAEYINYKNRIQKQADENFECGKRKLVKDILVVLDNLERALDSEKIDIQGVDLIYREFYNILKTNGLKKMESIGKKFDHNLHHAVSYIETEEQDEGYIIDE
ncbi:MAG: nucleotide exchange factor GrpE, partial [Elusimicrobiota bacterium]